MTGRQLRAAFVRIYGSENFHKQAAEELECNLATIYNHLNEKSRIPGAVKAWVKLKLKEISHAA